jgi:hypothetical protein
MFLTVSGAYGTPSNPWHTGNGKYHLDGTFNGKPQYKNDAGDVIQWHSGNPYSEALDLPKWIFRMASGSSGSHQYSNLQADGKPPRDGWKAHYGLATGSPSLVYDEHEAKCSTMHAIICGVDWVKDRHAFVFALLHRFRMMLRICLHELTGTHLFPHRSCSCA